jgi:hypothetical protein
MMQGQTVTLLRGLEFAQIFVHHPQFIAEREVFEVLRGSLARYESKGAAQECGRVSISAAQRIIASLISQLGETNRKGMGGRPFAHDIFFPAGN